MRQWCRTADMVQDAEPREVSERWSLLENGREVAAYDLAVRRHKPVDMRKLKLESLDELREYSRNLGVTARRMYSGGVTANMLNRCPCCAEPLLDGGACLRVFEVPYVRCHMCGHVFVQERPAREILEEEFRESSDLAATYSDTASCEERLAQIMAPKLAWVRQVYERCYGKAPSELVDVGAGGGHFVEMARRSGMQARGFELSAQSCAFARNVFGIELSGDDFLRASLPGTPVDCVTFWGLLEYAPDPGAFLHAARSWLSAEGLVVLEVPRYDCLGTALLRAFPGSVYRHIEPTSHIHCFSDASVATLLHDAGLQPVAAWYFGMDVYELLTQQALELNDSAFVDRFAHLVSPLQQMLDAHGCCDEVIIAARPFDR